jgi:uncharacterized protein (TIGR02996 family)
MTAETGFVRALQDDPFDETVRDIFGDWLEEQGDTDHLARRRLLRVQMELARWVADLAERRVLLAEEQALVTRHGPTWLGELATFARFTRFRAGLVDATFDAEVFRSKRFLAAAPQLFDAAWIGRVRVEFDGQPSVAVASSPALGRLRQFDLRGADLDDDSLIALLERPHLGELVCLDLSNNRLTDAAAAALAHADLPCLCDLDLRNNRLTAAGVATLTGVTSLPSLRRIDVHGNPLPAQALLEAHAFSAARGAFPTRDGLPARLVNSVGMEFALVPAGTFLMGSTDAEPERGASEGPAHEIELTQPFYLGVYPVTQRQYAAVVGNHPSHFVAPEGSPEHPVEMVTWENARSFCEQLSRREAEVLAGRVYTLPTEAQWEHACRAGTLTPFFFGDTVSSDRANFDGRHPYGQVRPGAYLGRTSAVGAYPANSFGIYDTHGNVWEWCADYYDERYYARGNRRDPTGPRSGNRVSARGGSWASHGSICRSATRDYWYGPNYCRDNIGFRLALPVQPGSTYR